MNENCFDITYGDLNPTLLFTGKWYSTKNVELHSHDFTQITYILSGKQKVMMDDQVYEISSGDLVMVNPGVKHCFMIFDEKDPALVFRAGFSDFHFKNMPPNHVVFPDGNQIVHTSGQLRQDLTGICLDMVAERYSNQAGQYFMQKSYLIQLLLLLIRNIVVIPVQKQNSRQFESYHKSYVVREIQNYLNEHYAEKISLDLIAKNMYLSSAYISKIFKEEVGEAPINYLIQLRLEKAKEKLVQEEHASIKSISTSVGYDDMYYFSKLFKKYYGVSPLHYRSAYERQAKKLG